MTDDQIVFMSIGFILFIINKQKASAKHLRHLNMNKLGVKNSKYTDGYPLVFIPPPLPANLPWTIATREKGEHNNKKTSNHQAHYLQSSAVLVAIIRS